MQLYISSAQHRARPPVFPPDVLVMSSLSHYVRTWSLSGSLLLLQVHHLTSLTHFHHPVVMRFVLLRGATPTAILPLCSFTGHHMLDSLLQTPYGQLPHCTQRHPKANMLQQTDTMSNRTMFNSAAHSLQKLNTDQATLHSLFSQSTRMCSSIILSLPFPSLDGEAYRYAARTSAVAPWPCDAHATTSWKHASSHACTCENVFDCVQEVE
jgi:hypothetical protein